MSENILELAKQAGVSAQSETTLHPNQVKFAELIVEECCKVLQSEVIQHEGYGYNQFALHNKIKKHFLGSNDVQAQLDEEWYWAIK